MNNKSKGMETSNAGGTIQINRHWQRKKKRAVSQNDERFTWWNEYTHLYYAEYSVIIRLKSCRWFSAAFRCTVLAHICHPARHFNMLTCIHRFIRVAFWGALKPTMQHLNETRARQYQKWNYLMNEFFPPICLTNWKNMNTRRWKNSHTGLFRWKTPYDK